jgi:uncharacterized cupin superfamily protein
MKIFDIIGKVGGSGEYILGSEQTGSHGCYLIYGILQPGETGRELKPGHGHEEIVLALQGDITLTGAQANALKQGQALHLIGEETVLAGNSGTTHVVYVVSGGHAGHAH